MCITAYLRLIPVLISAHFFCIFILKFCATTVTKANIIRNTSTPMQEHYLLNLITVFYLAAIRRVERVQPFILNSLPVWPE